MVSPTEYQLHTAQTRPDLFDALQDRKNPLPETWPRFTTKDLTAKHFKKALHQYSGLRKYQFAIVEATLTGSETMIAYSQSIPFFWPELEEARGTGGLALNPHVLHSLPDGGWDTILSRGVRQHMARERLQSSSLPTCTKDQEQDRLTCQMAHSPNALSALNITVRQDRRRLGKADRLLEAMKQRAREEHFEVLVVPLRPTRKSEYPSVPMGDYVSWMHTEVQLSGLVASPSLRSVDSYHSPIRSHTVPTKRELPFDPWLRKHVLLRGKIAKIAPSSMVVEGDIIEWQEWTEIDFPHLWRKMMQSEEEEENLKREPGSDRVYMEIPIPGGLVPLKVYRGEKRCTYVEPNVWLYHDLASI